MEEQRKCCGGGRHGIEGQELIAGQYTGGRNRRPDDQVKMNVLRRKQHAVHAVHAADGIGGRRRDGNIAESRSSNDTAEKLDIPNKLYDALLGDLPAFLCGCCGESNQSNRQPGSHRAGSTRYTSTLATHAVQIEIPVKACSKRHTRVSAR